MNPKTVQSDDATTLGDLLYADASDGISEADWVSILQSIAAGDQQALRTIYDRTNRLVFTLAMRISGSREIAEELTVDVFHDVWRRAREYDPNNGSVLGWIMMQTRSRAIDRVRFEQRKKRVDPHPHDHEEHVEAKGPASVNARQQQQALQQAMTSLTPDERETIETAFFDELSYSETATRLDQPVGTVKTRVRSALAKLRKTLEDGQ